MAKYQIDKSEFIFVILCLINTIFRLMGVSRFEYAIIAALIFMYLANMISAEKCLLLSMFVPDKYLQLAMVGLYLLVKGKLISRHMDKEIALFSLYALGSGVINAFLHSGNIFQVLFQVSLYYCVLRFAMDGRNEFGKEEVSNLFDKLFVLQIFIIGIQFLYSRRGGDSIKGSFINAHYLGVFLVVYFFIVVKQNVPLAKKIICGCVVLATIILCDAKHVGAIFVASYLMCFILKRIMGDKRIIWFMSIALLILVFIGGWILTTSDMPGFIENSKLYRIYVLNNEYNKKIVFICRTMEQMISINGIMGFGVGLYGSQIAITMGKGVIYPWDSSLIKYDNIAQPYKYAIEGLMTEGYVKYGISNSSMVLGYPLVSFVAMVAELGWIGFIWFIRLLNRAYLECDKSLILFFLGICVFDTYFEIASVFVLVMIGTVLSDKKVDVKMMDIHNEEALLDD